ncbi:MAG TPA: DUF488 domain-containing protein [Chitinophaga sp.]|uniref:DUF488 domain-containing protein n=1 Tax=Chitinophaga sp. TaxID=1869181 RepID=UPI002C634D9F|nr:DUF488 domain-containing protein [Chitinophaga sp.]HVI43973.1 DUF488 domain-containing protein [Chitinophaga sp.]
MSRILIKRAYEAPEKKDGYRVLVDGLWPRGIKKEDLHVDTWLKTIAPSTALRKWFGHDPEKWNEFRKKYKAELKDTDALAELKAVIKEHPVVTLLFGARDETHNNAQVLLEILS